MKHVSYKILNWKYYVFILFIVICNFILAVPVMKLSDDVLKVINNYSDWAVPMNWEIQSLAERDRIGKEVKNYLFDGKTISWSTLNKLVMVSIFNHNKFEAELNWAGRKFIFFGRFSSN